MSKGRLRESVAAAACLLRRLPLFFASAPKTPLRVLGIVAFDTLHTLRHARGLPRQRARALAMFLDFQGYANASLDHKTLAEGEYEAIRHGLERAGLGPRIDAYMRRLQALESRRPPIGGDARRFDEVRAYREAVARLSITTAAAIALESGGPVESLRVMEGDDDVDTLFRILMLCQIIDDVLDYEKDLRAGLPSFLTAAGSLPAAMELTTRVARSYAPARRRSHGDAVFPFRAALHLFTVVTKLLVRAAHRRRAHRHLMSLSR